MKQINLIQLGALLLVLLGSPLVAQEDCRVLIWSDEFEVSGAPDPQTWTFDLGTGDGGWGNRETQVYRDGSENVRVENGNLVINAIKNNAGQWTSARVKSQGRQNFQYGRIEFRAQLPAGSGTWPALWLLGENFSQVGWPRCGEIDVMEHVGKDPGKIHGSLHSPSSFGNTQNTGTTNLPTFSSEFHVYSVDWTPQSITFQVDGTAYYVYAPNPKNDDNWPFDQPFFLIMNIAMGGNFGSDPQYETGGSRNGVDPNLNFAEMLVDYVRVYQALTEAPAISGDSIVESNATGLQYSVPVLGGSFNWSVPEGATITAGQGTNAITVDWGDAEGDVKVVTGGDCGTFTSVLKVRKKLTPIGPSIVFDDFEDGDYSRWTPVPGEGNTFELTEENGELRVIYDISSPGQNPNLLFDLGQPVDLTTLSQLEITARTNNTSGTVIMRADLIDAVGVETNASPVFRLEPIVDDGNHHTYRYNFKGDWESSFPNAGAFSDSTAIQGLRLYINYGFFGSAGADTIWLDKVEMINPLTTNIESLPEGARLNIYPNPAKDRILIQMEGTYEPFERTLRIDLFSIQGKNVRSDIIKQGTISKEINVSGLTPGLYLLRISEGKNGTTRKILIE